MANTMLRRVEKLETREAYWKGLSANDREEYRASVREECGDDWREDYTPADITDMAKDEAWESTPEGKAEPRWTLV